MSETPESDTEQRAEFDRRMLDALAAAARINDPAPSDLADQVLARVQEAGSTAWKAKHHA